MFVVILPTKRTVFFVFQHQMGAEWTRLCTLGHLPRKLGWSISCDCRLHTGEAHAQQREPRNAEHMLHTVLGCGLRNHMQDMPLHACVIVCKLGVPFLI